ncbi:hypothetical protein LCGC14_2535310, partial [marine sediment metagenome]
MVFSWTWMAKLLNREDSKIAHNWSWALLPVLPGGKPSSVTITTPLVLNKASRYKSYAKDFIQYYTSYEGQVREVVREFGNVALMPAVYEDSRVKNPPAEELAKVNVTLEEWTELQARILEAVKVVELERARKQGELDRALWHNPEFLREAVAEHDFLNSAYTLVGYAGPGDEDDFLQNCDALDALYGTMNVHPLYCAATESELAKLATNAYLATQISFWNQMQWLAEELGVNSHQVARLVALDSRVSPYGAFMHGKPYSGPCLPKDVAQLLALSLSDPEPVPTPLLEAVQRINLMMGGA